MRKLKLRIPAEVRGLSVEQRQTVLEQFAKALGFRASVKEQEPAWQPNADPNIAALEEFYYNELAEPLWLMATEVFEALGLELPANAEVEKAFRSWNEADHPRDAKGRFATKWGRAIAVGKSLDSMRRKYRKDLRLDGMPRDKVTALMVALIDKGCFRIGNDESAEERGVFGLTTLKREHVEVSGNAIIFRYKGKSGVQQERRVVDRELARVMGEVLEIEGGKKSGGKKDADDAIFKYYNTKKEVRTPSQYVINSYLEPYGVTAKDFRTFHASRLVFEKLAERFDKKKTKEERQADIEAAIVKAAEALGHTPDTCKRYYVDPNILKLYVGGKIKKSLTTDEWEWEDFAECFANYYEEELAKSDVGGRLRSGVRRRFAERLRFKPDGKPWTVAQMSFLDKLLRRNAIDPERWAESMATRATVLAKMLSEVEQENRKLAQLVIETMPHEIQAIRVPFKLRTTDGVELPVLPLQSQEVNAIEWARMYAGEQIATKQQDLISGVKRLVMQARQERWSVGKLEQELFDRFGHYNRDWRRIALTEMAYAINNGYLMTLQDGESVMIQEAADACPKCKAINVGKLFTFRKEPGKDDSELWVGKSNYGRKTRDWVPCAPLHPHCRGRYVRVNTTFYRMDDSGNLVLKTAEEIMAERGITRAEEPEA